MSNDKMREEFEIKYPLPGGIAWKESIGMYEVVDIWKMDKPMTISRYNWLWEGWQASRAAVVIELPQQSGVNLDWNQAIRYCHQSIEAAGLKVKS